MMTKSERLNKEFNFSSVHAGLVPDDTNSRLHDRWLVTINGQQFDYFTGIGHRKHNYALINKRMHADILYARVKNPTSVNVQRIIEHDTKAVPPKLDDVLYCLITDSEACSETFESWCSNLGFDTDSRKAMDTYLACQKNGEKLRKAGVTDIEAAREAFQDY